MIFSKADIKDDQGIAELLEHSTMPGMIEVTFKREPSFFESLKVEGYFHDVIVGRDEKNKIQALGTRSIKKVHLHKSLLQMGYLGALRVAPKMRNMKTLLQGYKAVYEGHQKHPADFNITSISETNKRARKILESGRFGLPSYHYVGQYVSHTIRPVESVITTPYEIRQAVESDLPQLLKFIEEQSATYPLLPHYSETDFVKGLLLQLQVGHVNLCFDGDELIGCMALWDQQGFRQNQLKSYSLALSLVRPAANLFSGMSGYPVLPKKGNVINSANVALPIVKKKRQDIYEPLLKSILNEAKIKGYDALICGSHKSDPLQECCKAYKAIVFENRIYLVSWEEIKQRMINSLSKFFYLELGSL